MPEHQRSVTRGTHFLRACQSGLAAALTTYIVAFGLVWAPTTVADEKSDQRARLGELQQKARELNEQITTNQKAAAAKKKEAQSLANQIETIENDIAFTEVKIEEAGLQIEDVEGQIVQKEADIAARQVELDKQKGNQDETLRVLYETGQEELLFMIAGTESISDMVEHNEYLEALEDQIDATIAEVERLKRDLEEQRSQLQAKQQELVGLKAQQEAYKAGLDNERNRKDELLGRTKEQQAQYESLVSEAKQLNAQVESEMSSLRAKLTKSSGPGVVQARDRGTSSVGFQWPTDYRYISTYFGGSTPFQPGGGHGGLDLVNSSGTPIYASGDGTVTSVEEMTYNGRLYAYGRYVVVGHNARWSSLYAHLQSFAVSPGDEVKRGDIIGYMGSTGWSTGPHLHFEIWEYSSRVNPVNYLP